MNTSPVTPINIKEPIVVLGKHFTGDYSRTQQFIIEVQNILKSENIDFIPYKVLGIYYDNPGEKSPDELRSFHAVFPVPGAAVERSSLEKFELEGGFLQVKVIGDPFKTIMNGYNAMFAYIREHQVQLKSAAGYQVSTFENGEIHTEILMQVYTV
ncbi:MAG TPA: GyrI-like domain-containing protein [Chitinophagaceae bacterium]|nr:GyrI-like domain-containing protein [Chitinophagaceae bacterium]